MSQDELILDESYFKVEADGTDGIHNDGLIDAQGHEIIPAACAFALVVYWNVRASRRVR